ncbi:MAG TPA: glycosyl transferase, partial [Terrabacter sp.]|nr:glycosyl transferase [Terrabacter sp.]
FRMFSSSVGGQVSWLIPSALILLVAGLWLRGRRPRTDLRRAAYLVWGGWLVVTMLVFSFMAGIFHEYYTVALAPAIGALVGMGAVEAWERRSSVVAMVALAASAAAAAVWGFVLLSRTTAYGDWLRVSVLAVGMAAAVLLLVVQRLHLRAVPIVLAGALLAGLAGPAAYAVSTTAQGHSGSIVTAGPAGSSRGPGGFGGAARGGVGAAGPFGGQAPQGQTGQQAGPQGGLPGGFPGGLPGGTPGGAQGGGGMGGLLDASTPSTAVVAALSADAQKYTWVAAAVGSQTAAGLQLGTQLPVMAIGGFNGSDPSPTLAQFQQYVAQGQIHYFAGGGRGFGNQNGGSSSSSEISSWVQANFAPVTIDGSTFYDLTQPLR